MPVVNLTARLVQNLKLPANGQVDYWDKNQENFSIRVSASGHKTWTICYRFHRRKRRLSLGTFPATSLAVARKRARKHLDRIADGFDPVAEKIQLHQAGTFGELSTLYLERHAIKKKSVRNQRWMINRHLLPRWRHVKARDISRPDVRALIESITDKGAPVLANRVLALVSKMFNFGIGRDWRTDNPCLGIEKNIEKSCKHVLGDDDIRKVWNALQREDPFFRALFQLRFLTAARGGEVRHMRWADVDLDAGWWNLPPEFVKNDRAHRLPLVAEACHLLDELRGWQTQRLREINIGRAKKKLSPRHASEWVFPSPRGDESPFDWEQRATNRIRASSGIDFRPHDIRRTVATSLRDHGYADRELLKIILNHVDRDITGVYDRSKQDGQKRAALEAWGRRLKGIIGGDGATATVVSISKGQR